MNDFITEKHLSSKLELEDAVFVPFTLVQKYQHELKENNNGYIKNDYISIENESEYFIKLRALNASNRFSLLYVLDSNNNNKEIVADIVILSYPVLEERINGFISINYLNNKIGKIKKMEILKLAIEKGKDFGVEKANIIFDKKTDDILEIMNCFSCEYEVDEKNCLSYILCSEEKTLLKEKN